MTAIPPVKPPRGIKHAKETSGLLMSVIRALSASETNEQREVEKAKLEKEYKRSDQRLDELVSLHDQDLTQVMQIFSTLSERVTASREKIHAVKENLNACKQLLRCRREELMKLWLEGIEHKHLLQLLDEIDQLRDVPSRLGHYLNKKLYLHATQLLVSALSLGDGTLEGVEALREVRTELEAKEQQLHVKLLEELSKHLYIESTREVLLKRQGSGRDFQRGNESRGSRGNKVRRALLDVMSTYSAGQAPSRRTSLVNMGTTPATIDDLSNIVEDENATNPEENSEHFLAIIIECLALLNKIPEAVEAVKVQMQTELLNIVGRTSKKIKEMADNQPTFIKTISAEISEIKITSSNNATEKQSLLLDLLQTVFEQFRLVAAMHAVVLRSLSHVVKKYNLDVRLYEMPDVWSKIQAVLQLLLTEYLDIQNMGDDPFQTPTSLREPASDINTYFARRKPQRQKNGSLFKFDSSSHTMTLNSYLKEHRYSNFVLSDASQSFGAIKEKRLVCEPDPQNITVVFRPMMKFIEEIEQALGCKPGNPCTLNTFIADYVKEVYLGRHHVIVATAIDTATKSQEAWRATTSPELMKELGLPRPLLQSTVKVEQCVNELRSLMTVLPLQGEHFCTLALNILHNYRETCQAAYRGIVQPESEDKRICSAAWLKDDDISRFIKSLPNWANLKYETHPQRGAFGRRSMRRQETQDEESPEEVRQRNLREAEILASNLGEGGINAHEILSDVGQLRGLALLQESMEWFSLSIQSFVFELRQAKYSGESQGLPPMPEALVESLHQLAVEFDELANTCILVLHLEVRVQCFHYLLPRGEYSHLCGGARDAQEADPRVEELCRVMQHIDEAMQSILHPKKAKYIFEGLGHLIAKIIITSAQFMEKIDEIGIQRMCRNVFALQQTLTNITMARELAMDHARQYFELFYQTPEEILNGVLEKGPQFSELEYMNAFQLISRSQQDYGSINKHLEKLSEILGEVGVTV
ncbi:exocyst complex component 4 isoform X1 [Neodiprion virginianus]|uniref:exocyst complex component 4 isoform X1 n=1 Tax=Neodiprion fabricii TaxID=2872261 RepID=UPI001ED94716|nr:exocyst complex component 4 isoform X1 [Neodiprion fabricii]XP_046624153.1 exocyst complex component 4 isoform X1 [Neodiprion virginianus]